MGDGGVEALLEDAEGALDQEAEHAFEGGYLLEEERLILEVDGEEFGVFDGFDKQVGRLLFGEAGEVAYPPILDGEEEYGFDAVLVDIIATDTAFEDEGFEVAGLAFLQEEGLFL